MNSNQYGFSLVELSIVLVVVGSLAASLVVPLKSSFEMAKFTETQKHLTDIKVGLTGFVLANGRLPCPVNLSSDISEFVETQETCRISTGGVPGSVLGVPGVLANSGALLDSWGRPYVYTVSLNDHSTLGEAGVPDWLSTEEISELGASQLKAELSLCRSGSSNKCPNSNLITNEIVWLVLSRGADATATGIQIENQDGDTIFTLGPYSQNKLQPFDDQIVWTSRSELVYWLLRANWLP